MPDANLLLVLVVRETGLRSTLVAQLSLAGADLVTASDVHDPALARSVRRPAVLVLEEATVAARSAEWLQAMLEEPQWRRVVVLGAAADDAAYDDPRLICLDRATAPAALAELLPRWQREG